MEPIHLHHEGTLRRSHLYFLLIPSLVFFLTLTIFMFSQRTKLRQLASSNQTSVLGEETNIDNETKILKNK